MLSNKLNETPCPAKLYHWFVRPKWLTKKYIHNHIQNYFNLENHKVLDFGSGTGANCPMVNVQNYIGVDIDTKRVQLAQQLYPKYKFEALEGYHLPIKNNSIDYILIIAVLHHVKSMDIQSYINEFHRILKPNGSLVMIEPFICKKHPFCNWFMRTYDKGLYLRTENQYLELFKKNHFSCNIIKKFKKCMFYNEMFFSAKLMSSENL